MRFSKFFIERPIFATVLSLLLLVAGGVSLFVLPIDQYPSITPPTVQVTAMYPGANAETINGELSEEDDENDPDEDDGKHHLAAKDHPDEHRDLRAYNHKLVCEGVDELTKLGDEIASAGDLSVKHIGKSGQNVKQCRHYGTPDLDISHKNEGSDERGHERNSDKRECIRHV